MGCKCKKLIDILKTLCSNKAWFICRAGQYFWNWTDKKVKTRDTRLFEINSLSRIKTAENPFSSSKELTCIEMTGNCFYLNHLTSNIFLQNLSSWVRFEWAPCFANVKRIVQYSSTVQYLHPYNHMLNSQDWSLDLKKENIYQIAAWPSKRWMWWNWRHCSTVRILLQTL